MLGRRIVVLGRVGLLLAGASGFAVRAMGDDRAFREEVAPLLAKYCNGCHGAAKPKGGLDLTAFADEAAVVRAPKVWARVIEYVDGGDMPPEGKPKPSAEEAATITRWVEKALVASQCGGEGDPGRVTMRRLNRAEYNNTIRDLVGVAFQPAEDFPLDDVGYGFDNNGDVLALPPVLMERYLAAAERIAEQAIVLYDPGNGPVKRFEGAALADAGGVPDGASGRMLASEGEIGVKFDFPKGGDYLVRVRAFGEQAGPEPARMAIKADGKVLNKVDVPAIRSDPKTYEAKIKTRGGSKRLAVAFLNDYYKSDDPDPDQRDRNLVIESIEVQGPVESRPVPESHRSILFRRPKPGEDHAEVAREVIERFASRAYRRPATVDEVARLVPLVAMAERDGEPFARGIQLAVEAILVSPHFLFRVELDRQPGLSSALHGDEIASRLSYFLWSSLPDEELTKLARAGALQDPSTLEAQARRMLADPKAHALVENFAGQWLQTRNLERISPDPKLFPAFDADLRAAMRQETDLFFEAILREDRPIGDLLDADFTFVNERLAKHYGLDGVKGREFRRVALPDGRRGGILTQASVLTVTSNATRTSPVKRGKWVLEQILGTPPPPPPPGAGELSEEKGAILSGSLRQRMEQHRAKVECATCHARMDPLGFGLENFDAVGAWRDKDGEFPIDASGTLPSGQSFNGPKELRAILKAREKEFARSLATKLMTYALGRGLEFPDRCAVDKVVGALAGDGQKFSRLVVEVVKSDPFRKRRGAEPEKQGGTP